MKTKKRFLSILLSLVMVLGLLPWMSVMANADGPHHIYNEISAIIPGLSITKNGTTVTDASSGDTITLTISGQPVTGKIGTLFQETDRIIESRNIMIERLQAYKANGTTITTNSTGSQTWSFTMPDEDVYVAFPPLTKDEAISINAGEAAFRTGFATLDSYCFYTHITTSDGDSFGYLAYKDSNGGYNYTSNDDGGGGRNFRIPDSTSLAIKKSTFYHLGFAEYSNSRSGTFTIPAISGSMDIPFGAQNVSPQTVTAEDIEMSFGEICTIAATTDGNGTLSYKVENGDDVIDVNNSTGVITTKKTGTASVKITASGTTTYAVGNKTINVTVNKARAIVATVNENSRTYDGTEKPLVTVDNSTLVGGTMQYALGTDSTTEPTSGWNEGIPAGTDVGTYYVWYKAKGDSNHIDSATASVIVTIAEKQTEAPADPATPEETEAPAVPDNPKDEAAPAKIQANASIQLNAGFLVYWKGSTVCVKWGKAPEADQFEIYAQYCGSKTCKKIMTVKSGNSASFKRLNGKKLNRKLVVKVYVVASKNGKEIGRTLLGHAAGSKNSHTNAKNVKVSKKSYTLAVGKSAKIKAKIVKAKSGKKLLGKGHCAKVRYTSSNTKVATVSKSGKIKAVGKGKCDIRIFAQNGRSCKVTVTVK